MRGCPTYSDYGHVKDSPLGTSLLTDMLASCYSANDHSAPTPHNYILFYKMGTNQRSVFVKFKEAARGGGVGCGQDRLFGLHRCILNATLDAKNSSGNMFPSM